MYQRRTSKQGLLGLSLLSFPESIVSRFLVSYFGLQVCGDKCVIVLVNIGSVGTKKNVKICVSASALISGSSWCVGDRSRRGYANRGAVKDHQLHAGSLTWNGQPRDSGLSAAHDPTEVCPGMGFRNEVPFL